MQVIRLSSWKPGCLRKISSNIEKHDQILLFDMEKYWDEGISLLLFAVRESVQESFWFSPFELVFGHTVRGPLKLLKKISLRTLNLLQYVSDFKNRLSKACEAVRSNLKSIQSKRREILNLEKRYLLFCPFLVSLCKLDIMVLIQKVKWCELHCQHSWEAKT